MTILTVCTGNVCRSPLAEQLLVAKFDALGIAHRFSVSSAGVGALVGEPMDALAAEQSRLRGGDPDDFIARALTPSMAAESMLVLAATLAHRNAIVREVPSALNRTFTLAEFAALGQATPAAAAKNRGSVRAVEADDVVDPYGRTPAVHAQAAQQIDRATTAIVGLLARSLA